MNSKSKNYRPLPLVRKNILLVDDDLSVRQMIGRVLAEEGYHVLSAANGFEAIELADTNAIDLVLLDLNMPGKNGWETFERITTCNPNLSVIIITAKPNQLFTSMAAGVGALLEKPLDFNLLLRTVRDLLDELPEQRLARMMGKAPPLRFYSSNGKEFEA